MAGRFAGAMMGALAVAVVLMLVGTVPVDATHFRGKKTVGSGLSSHYYDQSCPGGLSQINTWIQQLVAADNTLPAAWVRLQFHDCFVRGCDASVLINNGDPNAEITSFPNRNSLRGLTELNTVKANIEAVCPGVVSCADLVVLAARDAVYAANYGPYWSLKFGRKDGAVSLASESNAGLPAPTMNYSTILPFFTNLGLSVKDLVVLSGAHTIGFTHCSFLLPRLYNFPGSANGVDPTLDPAYAVTLQQQCPNDGNSGSTRVFMDPTGNPAGLQFDSNYMKGVTANKGAFTSDAALKTNSQSNLYVKLESSNLLFSHDFGDSMQKLSLLNVLTGSQGNVRLDCSKFN